MRRGTLGALGAAMLLAACAGPGTRDPPETVVGEQADSEQADSEQADSERAGSEGAGAAGARRGETAEPAAARAEDPPPAGRPREEPPRVGPLELVTTTRKGLLYAKPGHHLGSYDAMLIDPVVLSYKRGAERLTRAQEEALREELRAMVARSLGERGIELREAPDACTLRVRVHVAELELLDTARDGGAGTTYLRRAGTATLVLEYWESVRRMPLLSYGRRHAFPGGRVVGGPASLSTAGLMKALAMLLEDAEAETRRLMQGAPQEPHTTCEGALARRLHAEGRAAP